MAATAHIGAGAGVASRSTDTAGPVVEMLTRRKGSAAPDIRDAGWAHAGLLAQADTARPAISAAASPAPRAKRNKPVIPVQIGTKLLFRDREGFPLQQLEQTGHATHPEPKRMTRSRRISQDQQQVP